MIGMVYDCPKCGLKESAVGDRFCGKCEGEFLREEQEQRWREEDPYMREWGQIVFLQAECGKDYLRPADEVFAEWAAKTDDSIWGPQSPEDLPNVDNTIRDYQVRKAVALFGVPDWVWDEKIKACEEARHQFRVTGTITPPAGYERYVPTGE
jgi:hypothetical protein